MKRLSQEIGTTTLLAKENNGSLLYTLKHEPAKKIIATPEVGEVAYLHSTSIGKAILAFSKHQLELIDKLDLYPMTKRTITSKNTLTQELLIIEDNVVMRLQIVKMKNTPTPLLPRSLIIMVLFHQPLVWLIYIKRNIKPKRILKKWLKRQKKFRGY